MPVTYRWLSFALSVSLALCAGRDVAAQSRRSWYLAEGITGTTYGFEDEILIGNPNPRPAAITISFFTADGTAATPIALTVGPTSRATVRLNDLPGMSSMAFGARIDADADIVVERSIYWVNRRGGHNAFGVTAPQSAWFFAEGATGLFNSFVLLANPDATRDSDVRLSFAGTGDAPPITHDISVPALQRRTVWINGDVPGMTLPEFATTVVSTNHVPVLAERSMFWGGFAGGTAAVGAAAPADTWRFPTGASPGEGETFLLIANPNARAAPVRLTFRLADGSTESVERTIHAGQRHTMWVNHLDTEEGRQREFRVTREPASVVVESTGDVPIVVERASYARDLSDGHASPGVAAESAAWAFAEGIQGSHHGRTFETSYVLASSSDRAVDVLVTFYREDGRGLVRHVTIPAAGRATVQAGTSSELRNRKFAAFFKGDGFFVAERVVTWNEQGGRHGSLGVPWPAQAIATPAAAAAPGGAEGAAAITPPAHGAAVAALGPPVAVYCEVFSPAGVCQRPLTWPFPRDLSGVIAGLAQERPDLLRGSCAGLGGSTGFLVEAVARLRQATGTNRWGLTWLRGREGDLDEDGVAYFYGPEGAAMEGDARVYLFDIIGGHCSTLPTPQWNDVTERTRGAGAVGRWTTAGQVF